MGRTDAGGAAHPPAVGRAEVRRERAALARNLGAVVCWSVAPVMIRATREHFSVLYQTFARYLVSLAVLWPVVLLSGGRDRSRRDLRSLLPLLPRILGIAAANYAFQTTYTLAFYKLLPGYATLVNQSGVLFAAALALAFFPDERRILGDRLFQLGLVAAVAGVLVTIVAGGLPSGGAVSAGEGDSLLLGVLAMLASAFSWALLGTLVKKWLHDVNPLFALSAVFTIVTPLFLLTDVAISGALTLPRAPPAIWAVLLLSGLVGVGLGHSLYYSAVPVVGVTVSSSLSLLVPLLAGLLSFAFLGERFGAARLAGATLVLGGCWLVVRRRFRPPS